MPTALPEHHPHEQGIGQPLPPDAAHLEIDLTLIGGEIVHVRPIRPDDTARLRAFHAHLSFETIVYRFFCAMPQLALAEAEHFTHVDYENRMALVATRTVGSVEEVIGVVRYDCTGPSEAEVAFVVQDAWQGHGIATALLHRLAAYARVRGITTFVAITMASNLRMLDVLRRSGFPCDSSYQDGDSVVTLDISAPPAFPPGSPIAHT